MTPHLSAPPAATHCGKVMEKKEREEKKEWSGRGERSSVFSEHVARGRAPALRDIQVAVPLPTVSLPIGAEWFP